MTGKEYCVEKSAALYPEKLRQIRNAPKRLYVRGMLPQKEEPCVAIMERKWHRFLQPSLQRQASRL